MTYNEIEKNLYPERARFFYKRGKIVEIAEFFIYGIIVGYIVAAVFKRTFKYGVEPYDVRAESRWRRR